MHAGLDVYDQELGHPLRCSSLQVHISRGRGTRGRCLARTPCEWSRWRTDLHVAGDGPSDAGQGSLLLGLQPGLGQRLLFGTVACHNDTFSSGAGEETYCPSSSENPTHSRADRSYGAQTGEALYDKCFNASIPKPCFNHVRVHVNKRSPFHCMQLRLHGTGD